MNHRPQLHAVYAPLASVANFKSQAGRGGKTARTMTPSGVAVVPVVGLLSKYDGEYGSTYSDIAARVAAAEQAEHVRVVMLDVESPGGATFGASMAADAIASCSKVKPVIAHVRGVAASAAYWLASQANTITAERDALVGSVGSYAIVTDFSEMEKAAGLRSFTVRAGRYKGIAEPGPPITGEDEQELVRVVGQINELFVEAVSRGRRLTGQRLDAVTDGRVHVAADAKRLGLIDDVATTAEAMDGVLSVAVNGKRAVKRDPVARWQDAVKSAGSTRAAVLQHPDLHAHYLRAYTAEHNKSNQR